MAESHGLPLLRLPRAAQAALVAGARDNEPVRGLTHNFYKYPARFSPIFARAAIEAFTQPGDLVLDNHVGGGTTLVEALATGRPVAERFLVSPIAMHIRLEKLGLLHRIVPGQRLLEKLDQLAAGTFQ